MGDWEPTKQEEKMHRIFDELTEFAKELNISTDLVDALFNTFYNALDEQGKMSIMEVTEEERMKVMGEVWEKMVKRGLVDFSKIPEC